jgi:hypothetical protein
MKPTVHDGEEGRGLKARRHKERGKHSGLSPTPGREGCGYAVVEGSSHRGAEVLRRRLPSGTSRRVATDPLARIRGLRHQSQVWSRRRVAELVRVAFRIRYHPPRRPATACAPLESSAAQAPGLQARQGGARPPVPRGVGGHQGGTETPLQSIWFIDASGFDCVFRVGGADVLMGKAPSAGKKANSSDASHRHLGAAALVEAYGHLEKGHESLPHRQVVLRRERPCRRKFT